jgi:hypothetical protein
MHLKLVQQAVRLHMQKVEVKSFEYPYLTYSAVVEK